MSTKTEKQLSNSAENLDDKHMPLLSKIGFLLIFASVAMLVLNYFPVVTQEIKYVSNHVGSNVKVDGGPKIILPLDTDFGIVVSKIGANAHVIADVNPFDSRAYQVALTKGVAHSKGSAKPGEDGNVFLFAHSSDNFFNANKYNSIFYLLHRMEKGDTFDIYYKGEKFTYEIINKVVVDPTDTKYMEKVKGERIATLMTCWPAGTTLKRLILVGKQL